MPTLDASPRLLVPTQCTVGEGAFWHAETATVYFLDIPAGEVHTFDPQTGAHRIVSKGRRAGGLTAQENGDLLLFQDGAISILGLDGAQHLVRDGLSDPGACFNDLCVDPEGRIYAGELGGRGRLLRIDTDGSVAELFGGIGCTNGMGFTLDLQHMYHTDSVARKIYRYGYDRKTGELSNRVVFADISPDDGLPDGMAVDSESFVWTAIWFGARLKRFAPDGALEREIHFPVRQTSSLAFAGADLADIYVTSAGARGASPLMPPAMDPAAPRGGGLYGLRVPGVTGRPLFRSRIRF